MSADPILSLYDGKPYVPVHKHPERLSWPLTPRDALSPAERACAIERPAPKAHGWLWTLFFGGWLWK